MTPIKLVSFNLCLLQRGSHSFAECSVQHLWMIVSFVSLKILPVPQIAETSNVVLYLSSQEARVCGNSIAVYVALEEVQYFFHLDFFFSLSRNMGFFHCLSTTQSAIQCSVLTLNFGIVISFFINNYITITEYISYKTYNLEHNIKATFTLLNYEFVTKTKLTKYFTLLTYCTVLTTLEITYLQNLA